MTVLKEGVAFVNMGTLMGVMTLVFMAVMIGWTVWAWLPSRKHLMDAAARLPLEED